MSHRGSLISERMVSVLATIALAALPASADQVTITVNSPFFSLTEGNMATATFTVTNTSGLAMPLIMMGPTAITRAFGLEDGHIADTDFADATYAGGCIGPVANKANCMFTETITTPALDIDEDSDSAATTVMTKFGFLLPNATAPTTVDAPAYIVEVRDPPVPEPGTVSLLGFGLIGVVAWRALSSRRRRLAD